MGQRTLVLVTLYGGNDGLNTVIPYGDSRYYTVRPRIAVPADQVLKLAVDRGSALNPQSDYSLAEIYNGTAQYRVTEQQLVGFRLD